MSNTLSNTQDTTIELPDNFFEDYWQHKPCVLRQATSWRPEITAEELAGIACEADADARLIFEENWTLEEGPFTAERFASLPASHWTLVVQAVDQWDEQVAQLKSALPQIPQWRLDDIMVTYAVDQGSVGPHYDHYDVFLVQGQGQRLWRLGPKYNEQTKLLEHEDLLLIQDMIIEDEYLLEAGDILYIPPQYTHWGIAQGECLTFSIGFRAPSYSEAMDSIATHAMSQLQPNQRVEDPPNSIDPQRQQPIAQIHPAVIADLRQALLEQITDKAIAQWLGGVVTLPRTPQEVTYTIDQTQLKTLLEDSSLIRNPGSRFAFYVSSNTNILVFIDGYATEMAIANQAWVEWLCTFDNLLASDYAQMNDESQALILHLVETQSLIFAD